ncbi:hypothetical protein [Heyndrickxia acidicola]|uniref:DUF2029 domain-containing protein n=1 Tax=Heyndrickxia acidicola TaxID=209389 RepID=A0ABU6MD18_9BACI|nr:hypothetical protein [Heyndrickxia acidicola]MED1201921.1 hypothetical protein [Heyndrickxia acidicola]
MTFYRLWVLAFFLKFVGSAWDASYHFKYLFEKYSIPHIVNFSGFALGLILLYTEWRRPHYMDRLSRNLTTVGYTLFLVGIPLDFSYHIAFGIDLTTWSPTHFIYYIGTMIMIIGAWRGYVIWTKDTAPSWKSNHTWFAMFVLEDLVFPNMQQENGAISYDQYMRHASIASEQILLLISNPKSQIFGGIPEWIYPNYSVLVVSVFVLLVSLICRSRLIPLAAAALYIVLRFAAKTIFFFIDYPTSYVPVTIIFIPLFYLLIRKVNWLAGLVGSLVYFFGLYWIHTSGILITPPLEVWEAIPVAMIGVLVPFIIKRLIKWMENKPSKEQ